MNEQKTNFDTETSRDDSDVILDVRNLDVYLNTYSGRIHAVRDVSFTLKKGETLVVVGESGCGKSMTARAIMQLLPEKISEVGEQSQILFNGTDTVSYTHLDVYKRQGEIFPCLSHLLLNLLA